MKYMLLILISINTYAIDTYEKGFMDAYYLTNQFDHNINPCSLIKRKECKDKDCEMDNLSKDTTCQIIYNAKKLDYLTNSLEKKYEQR